MTKEQCNVLETKEPHPYFVDAKDIPTLGSIKFEPQLMIGKPMKVVPTYGSEKELSDLGHVVFWLINWVWGRMYK